MLITGMNRYIAKHGKIIGLVILPIIIVTFVFYFGRGSIADLFSGQGNSSTVSILDRSVTLSDKQAEVTRMYIMASLQDPNIDLTSARMPLESQNIVINLLQNYAAEDMGIAVGEKEIREYLKTVPIFQTAGEFDTKKYDLYVSGKLKPAYLTQDDLKDAVLRMLQVQALRKSVSDSVIVPDSEVKEAYLNDMQSVEAQILKFDASTFVKDVVLKDEDLKNYYEGNKGNYNTNPAAKGKVVVISFDSCQKEALAQVSEKDLKKYYEDNKYRYKVENKIKLKSETKVSIPEPQKFKSYDSVKAEIQKKLSDIKVEEITLTKAQKFADEVAILTSDVFYDVTDQKKAKNKCMEIFNQSATVAKLKVEDSGWLYADTKDPKGFAKEVALVTVMAGLFADNPVSEPIKGAKGFIVAILDEKKNAAPQNFADAKEKIKADLLASRSLSLAREKARMRALEIGELLDKDKKFETITKDLKLKFEKLPEWSAQMLGYFRGGGNIQAMALETAFATQQGEVSPAKDSSNGAFVVYVVKKNIPTQEEFEKQKTMFAMRYKRIKQGNVYGSFLQSLKKPSKNTTKK